MTTRRGFLAVMLAAAAAPAIVRVDSLMKIVVPKPDYLMLVGDGIADDTLALQTLLRGGLVMSVGGVLLGKDELLRIPQGDYLISETLLLERSNFEFTGSRIMATKKLDYFLDAREMAHNVLLENMSFSTL